MRRRLVAMLVALPMLAVAVLGLPAALDLARTAVQRLAAERLAEAERLSGPAARALKGEDRAVLRKQVVRYRASTKGRARVLDLGSALVAGAVCTLTPGELSDRREVRSAMAGRPVDSSRYTLSWEAEELIVAVPVIDQGRLLGTVVICSPLEDLRSELTSAWLLLGLATVVALAVNGMLAESLSRRLLRPLRSLRSAARTLADGGRPASLPAHTGPAEFRALAGAFNEALELLERRASAQSGFVADASHQLRGPLGALRLRLENLEPHLDPEGARGLEHALSEADRLSRILGALLSLARCEGRAEPALAEIDAYAVVGERAAAWRPMAARRGVTVETGGARHPGIHGHLAAAPGALDQILDVFLDNALAVSPPRSTVRLMVRPTGQWVRITCRDQGPGMSENERRRAPDRFWRGRRAAGDGSGLGLSIASSLARAYGGELLLDPAPGSGLDATVVLSAWPPERTAHGSAGTAPQDEPCTSPASPLHNP
ncbi:sensor histidine kinase [Streptomyces sp. NPDC055078]